MNATTMTILAQSGSDGREIPYWIIAMLLLSLASWVAGKFKEWNERRSSGTPARRLETDDDEVEVVDIATLLGFPPQEPEARGRPPANQPTARRRDARTPTQSPPARLPTAQPAGQARPQPGRIATDRPIRQTPPPAPTRARPPATAKHDAHEPPPMRPVGVDFDAPMRPLSGDPTTARGVKRSARRRFAPVTRAELRRAIVLNEILGKPIGLRDLPD